MERQINNSKPNRRSNGASMVPPNGEQDAADEEEVLWQLLFENPKKDLDAFLKGVVSGVGEVAWKRKEKGQCFQTIRNKIVFLEAFVDTVTDRWIVGRVIAKATDLKREHPGIAVGMLMTIYQEYGTGRDVITLSATEHLNQLLDELHVTSFRFENEVIVKVTFNSFPRGTL